MRARSWLWSCALVFGALSVDGRDGEPVAPILLGGASAPVQAEVFVDPALPSGERRRFLRRVEGEGFRSGRWPLRYVGPPLSARPALHLLEAAYEKLLARGAPRPKPGFELAWRPDASGKEQLEVAPLDRRMPGMFGAAHALCSGGALTAAAAFQCVAEGLLASRAPAAASNLRRGAATLARLEMFVDDERDSSWQRALGRHPGRPLVARSDAAQPGEASALFFVALGQGARLWPSDAGFSALSLGSGQPSRGGLRYQDEPDVLDVLRASLDGDRARVADFFDAITRARFEPKAEDAPFGSEARSEPDWTLDDSTLPRRLSVGPLFPTGGTAIRLQLGALRNSTLGVRIECEAPVSTVWSLARERAGSLSSMQIPFKERGTVYEQRMHAEGAEALWVFGTNLGGVDLAHPYDPDWTPSEPHSCTVYLAPLSGL